MKRILIKFSKIPYFFKFLYKLVFLLSKLHPPIKAEYDLVYLISNEGWILEGVCKDVDRNLNVKSYFCYDLKSIPPSKAYYYSHYSLFISAVLRNPWLLKQKNIVQYTHYREHGFLSISDVAFVMNMSTKIFTMNTYTASRLMSVGVKPEKLKTTFIGVDEKLFYPRRKSSTKPTIGFNLRYEDDDHYFNRKNYDKVIEIIKKVDFCDVLLLGKGWNKYKRFSEVENLPYFQYVDTSYKEYPVYYERMDVFVSVSKLEGGPVPLLESMFCNVFPVVSNTGFAPDLIDDGVNGLLFGRNASAEEIIELIKKGIVKSRQSSQVFDSARHLTWGRFAGEIKKLLIQ